MQRKLAERDSESCLVMQASSDGCRTNRDEVAAKGSLTSWMHKSKGPVRRPVPTAVRAKGRADYFSAGERTFIEWARHSLQALSTVHPGPPWDDLAPLGRVLGDAKVVALGEAVHCGAEPLEFRNRLFQYLVCELGFTAIAIESGLVEGRTVHDYVRGGPGELSDILARGIGWTFDKLPQNAALIQWMHKYNAEVQYSRKINFYGFDVPGSPGNADARRGVDTALTEILHYLHRVDRTAASSIQARLTPLLAKLHFALEGSGTGAGYQELSQTMRDALTAEIADLLVLIERCEAKYTAATSPAEYAWAHRTAISARQVDAWLRHIPLGWKRTRSTRAPLSGSEVSFLPSASDVRDRAQADNLEWIVAQEGSEGKVLVFASRYHISAAPVKSTFWRSRGVQYEQEVAGTYLRRRFADRLVTIGNVVGEARTDHHADPFLAPRQSIDALAREIRVPLFLLDLRSAPSNVANWLHREHSLADAGHELSLILDDAFDVLLYIQSVTPASGRATVT
jgi:erythromycin esterase